MNRFYPIFDRPEWLHRLLPLGIKFVQMRIKDQPEGVVRAWLSESLEICAEYECALVVNDYWELAIELGAPWVHLGQEDVVDANVQAIKDAGLKLGLSTHDESELEYALSLEPDYCALGPVWPTRLKKMKWHEQGLDRVTQWKQRLGATPLCAIGGLTPERAVQALDAGADMAAVVTDITLNDNPEARVREWLEATQ